MPRKVFVDTSFFVALNIERDAHHLAAKQLWLETSIEEAVTSSHVLGETWTFMVRRAGHSAATAFAKATRASQLLHITAVDQSAEEDAWQWLLAHDEREYSFVDATSFAVMRRLGIGEALAFDGDFSAAGFVEVRV